jgi:hypothetical protein
MADQRPLDLKDMFLTNSCDKNRFFGYTDGNQKILSGYRMEVLTSTLAYDNACKTVFNLKKVLDILETTTDDNRETIKDSALKRFELMIITFFQFLQYHLETKHNIILKPSSRRSIFKAAEDVGIIPHEEAAQFYVMLSDYNKIPRACGNKLAEQIITRFPTYWQLIDAVLQKQKSDV